MSKTISLKELEKKAGEVVVATAWRVLELGKRLPEIFKERGWPLDEDLMAVAASAIGFVKANLGKQYRRPPAAAQLGVKHFDDGGFADEEWEEVRLQFKDGQRWGADEILEAWQVVQRLELQRLLFPR